MNSVEENIVALIRMHELQDVAGELAEASLDQLITEGFMREVPIVGSVLGTIRAAGSIRDFFLAKKLGRFLRGIQGVPLAEREAFADKLGSAEDRRKIGETLLLMLDRLDSMDKAEMIAALFKAFLSGEIDRVTFQRMSSSVDRLMLDHLSDLVAIYVYDGFIDPDVGQALSFAGLVRITARGDGGGFVGAEFAGAVIDYERTDFGAHFVQIITRDY